MLIKVGLIIKKKCLSFFLVKDLPDDSCVSFQRGLVNMCGLGPTRDISPLVALPKYKHQIVTREAGGKFLVSIVLIAQFTKWTRVRSVYEVDA